MKKCLLEKKETNGLVVEGFRKETKRLHGITHSKSYGEDNAKKN
jgi:hypothetical protein